MGRPKNTPEQFWNNANKNGPVPQHCPHLGPCWIWTRARDHAGYGVTTLNWKYMRAHRAAWFYHTGIMPEVCVLHDCDNPICVNPAHLHLGTTQLNTAEKVARGRQSMGRKHSDAIMPGRQRGEAHYAAKLTAENVMEMRKLWSETKISIKDLAAKFPQASPDSVEKAARGETWKSLPLAKRPEETRSSKLTKETVLEMRRLYEAGTLVKEIAHQFQLSVYTCNDVIYRRTWKWL